MSRICAAVTAILFTALLVGANTTARADLAEFLRKPEPAAHWEKRGETHSDGVTIYDLHLVSQTWQGRNWEHRLQIFRPDHPVKPHFCGLLNTGGGGSDDNTQLGTLMAKETGSPFAILFNIPNQPLYNGRTEDALIVYTWQRFMETGDPSWPLHFPMAKAVIKAMDAVQEFTRSVHQPSIDSFMVTGASKRGWTTWLAGASRDPRIKAIAPMVIDTLNLPAQIPHQVAMYGAPSEQVADYTGANMLNQLNTPRGRELMALEDPYSYRDILTLPKLLLLGTNDRYWSQDALNLYWDDLKGPKWVAYIPNSGHGLQDRARLMATLAAFARTTAGGKPWPRIQWRYSPDAAGRILTIMSSVPVQSARLFQTESDTMDFRDSHWASKEIPTAGRKLAIPVPAQSHNTASYAELTYDLDGHPFTVTTQLVIQRPAGSPASP